MDINKTIIQVDQAGGRTMEDVLNSNVAANTFGYIDRSNGQWKLLYGPLDAHVDPPVSCSETVLSYDAYIDRLYCAPSGMQQMAKADRDAVWKSISNARRQATRKFCSQGELGASYAPLVELQRQHLMHEGKYYQIIPSFFHMINTLSDLNMRFTLIFRTFGSDLDAVLHEWKQFIFGEHACKPSGPVLQMHRDQFVEPLSGSVFRSEDDVYICYGPRVSLSSFLTPQFEEADSSKVIHLLRQVPGCTSVEKVTFQQLHNHLVDYFARSNGIGGLVDYYPNWAQAAENRTGGKIFPIRQKDSENYYVFFDDNIFLGEEHSIVDVRDAEGAVSIIDPLIEKRYCIPSNSFKAIVDKEYFINELCACLKMQDAGG